MTTKLDTNGQARKSLGEQIDRLDAMLDGLSEGLNDAVASAVREAVGAAVQEAVQAVLREVLTNPELLSRLQPTAPAAPPAAASPEAPEAGDKQSRSSMSRALASWVAAIRSGCSLRLAGARRWAAGACGRLRPLGHAFRGPLLTALGVGAAVGVGAYFAGPWLAAACSAAGGYAAALTAQGVMAVRRLTTRDDAPIA